jgi:hypothetical protein
MQTLGKAASTFLIPQEACRANHQPTALSHTPTDQRSKAGQLLQPAAGQNVYCTHAVDIGRQSINCHMMPLAVVKHPGLLAMPALGCNLVCQNMPCKGRAAPPWVDGKQVHSAELIAAQTSVCHDVTPHQQGPTSTGRLLPTVLAFHATLKLPLIFSFSCCRLILLPMP